MPRDIATREIFKVCVQEGLSVEKERLCVYLDVTHLPRELLDRKLAGILEIYEKFQGVDPRTTAMKIFPAVHYTMGGLWVRLRGHGRRPAGDRLAAQPADQHSRAVCHRRVRIPVPRRQSPGGQFAGGLHLRRADRGPGRDVRAAIASPTAWPPTAFARSSTSACRQRRPSTRSCSAGPQGGPNPYTLHQELGRVMTESATVVRHNADLARGLRQGLRAGEQAQRCSLADTGDWANQNVVFVRALAGHVPAGQG